MTHTALPYYLWLIAAVILALRRKGNRSKVRRSADAQPSDFRVTSLSSVLVGVETSLGRLDVVLYELVNKEDLSTKQTGAQHVNMLRVGSHSVMAHTTGTLRYST